MVDRPYPGWSQQAPSAWVAATERVLHELLQGQVRCARSKASAFRVKCMAR